MFSVPVALTPLLLQVILHHSTTIGCGYQPVIHCGVLRQSAEMMAIKERETLKTGERATVKFRFLYFADYILPGATFIFRWVPHTAQRGSCVL